MSAITVSVRGRGDLLRMSPNGRVCPEADLSYPDHRRSSSERHGVAGRAGTNSGRRGISLLILDRKIAVYWSSRATGPTVLVWMLICFGNALKPMRQGARRFTRARKVTDAAAAMA